MVYDRKRMDHPLRNLLRCLWCDGLPLNKWSANQDASKDHEEAAAWLGRATAFSGPTMVIFALA
jgi:hypothetical protein